MADRLEILITATDQASGVVKGVEGALGGLGNLVSGAFSVSMAVGAGAVTGLAAEINAAVKAASDEQDAMAQTNAVLASTKGVAGVTADMVTRIANSLMNETRFSDDAVRSTENLLLTFTNISSDIFPKATEITLDMAQALGEDAKSAAIQLGKALQDPVLGVTALRRVGVNFSEAQQKVIKDLVAGGKAAEAQALIMKELQNEFGGSARAAGKTFAGQLDILKNQFGQVQERIGGAFIPVLQHMMNVVIPIIDRYLPVFVDVLINGLAPAINKVIDPLGRFIAQVLAGQNPIDAFVRLIRSLFPKSIAENIVGFIDTLRNLGDQAGKAFEAVKTYYDTNIKPVVDMLALKAKEGFQIAVNFVQSGGIQTTGQNLIDNFKPVVDWFKANWPIIESVALTVWRVVQDVIASAVDVIVGSAWPQLKDAFDELTAALKETGLTWDDVGKALLNGIKIVAMIIGALLVAAVAVVVGAINGIAAALKYIVPVIQDIAKNAVAAFSGMIQFFVGIYTFFDKLFRGDFPGALYAFQFAFQGAVQFIVGTFNSMLGWIKLILGTIVAFIGGAVQGIILFFQDLYNRLVGHSIIPDMMNAIRAVIQTGLAGVAASFQTTFNVVANVVVGVKNAIVGAITTALNTANSMVRQFSQFGGNIIAGIVDGIRSGAGLLVSTITAVINDTINSILNTLQIHSPSRVFANIGKNMMLGMEQGVAGAAVRPMGAVQAVTTNIVKQVGGQAPGDYNMRNYAPVHIYIQNGVKDTAGFLQQMKAAGA